MKTVLLIDFGSTYTKLTAVDLEAEKILGTAAAYTTVQTDINDGLKAGLAALNKKTTKNVNTHAEGLKIKASMKVGDAEKMFDTSFGVTVQIKDEAGSKLVPNGITIGQAARGEY